ncbi:hypothetical protein FSP39_024859 [Pinctada imbricata]|uniref:PH domain-containing protein n=1 Tax=Pinctada imbricata TaxID=66713 RepID=A0AA88Y640_PINIB|nr:hypothetical protein FSP39_024859 [Pinctada imbricata]
MEGRLGRCRGILGALFPTYYWFKLDEATLTLSYAVNQETIDEPLMEVNLMFAKITQKATKLYIETFLDELLTLKASSETEAKEWAVKMESIIKDKADLLRISDGEDEEIVEEDIVESPDEENSSDFLPETESVDFKSHQMKQITERIK